MSGTQVSSGPDPNILYKALSGVGVREQTAMDDTHANALLTQAHQQQQNQATDLEMVSRASAYLNQFDEAKQAELWPGVISQLQQYNFAMKANPSVFPGAARIAQLAAASTPSKELMEIGEGRAWMNAQRGVPPVAASGAAPGAAAPATAAIPARGTGGPGGGAVLPTEWLPHFYEASRETGIPVELLIAQARQESSFDPNARGKAGEIGLFQIMPSTARAPSGMTGVDPATLTGPENVRNNILFGARYLAAMAGKGVDWNNPAVQAAALRRYNAGGDPEYVAHVNQYRPSMSPTDPARAVTTYATTAPPPAPAGGVAARTGGTDVAGPPGTVPAAPAAPVAPVAGTGAPAVPAAPAATTAAVPGATPAPPAAPAAAPAATAPPAAAPPFTPPKPVLASGLTADQQRSMDALLPSAARTREGRANWTAKVEQLKQQNVNEQQEYETKVNTWQNQQQTAARAEQTAAQTLANQAAHLDLARRADQRAQKEADDKARERGETLVPGQGIEAVHENTLQKYAAKVARGEQLTEDEQRLYDGAYYAMQQSGGQTGTMTDPNNPGQQIPFQTTRRLPPNLPEPKGGALPPVISQPGAPKKDQMTEGQGQAAAFADRMVVANPIMEQLDEKALSWGEKVRERVGSFAGYSINSPDYQKLRVAQEAFLAGILRKESGAAVSPSEWDRYAKLYFPMPGDDASTVRLKRQFRQTAMEGMQREAGPTYKPPAAPTESAAGKPLSNTTIRVDANGKIIP
jgi:soluble lytic murein transglycosylase-like protein